MRDVAGRSPDSVVAFAHDEAKDSPCVVKLYQLGDDRFLQRAQRELERWRGLATHGVQKIIDVGSTSDALWYAAARVAGSTLAAEIAERRESGLHWTDKQVFQLGRKIAATLDQLHAQQIVHGDLKPSNVLSRSTDGDLILTDLGMARATELAEVPAWAGGLATHRHLSPDQLLGLKPLDLRSDLFQLGLILYECATLTHPCDGVETPQGLLDRWSAPVDPPEKLHKGFDPKLSRAIMELLSPQRDGRPKSVKEFARAWSSVTAKYESLTDVPIAAMNPDAAGPARKTRRFSGPTPRVTARARISQPIDTSIREIKPTPLWVQATGAAVLALAVGAAGLWLYGHETSARLEGGVEQVVGFAGTRLTYRTSSACETAVRVSGEGTQARTFKNAQEGSTTKHTVMISDLTPGRKYLAQVELGDGPPSENVALAAPVVRPIARVTLAPKGDDIKIGFTTPVKAKATAHAKVDGHETDLTLSAEPDTSHEATFEKAAFARLAELSIEAVDSEGERRSLTAGQLVDQVTGPLQAAVTAGPLAAVPLADAAEALDRAALGPALAELALLDAWPLESPDLSEERRRGVYRITGALERALARSGKPVPVGFAPLAPYLEGPLAGRLATTAEVAGPLNLKAAGPVALLAQLGAFTRLKPGVFNAGKRRVAYDPKPEFADVAGKNVAVVHLPAPPAGAYRTAELALAVSAVPRDGLLTLNSEAGEMVLWSPVARAAPPQGEQWLTLRVPPAAFAGSPATVSIAIEPVGAASPAPLKVLGALLVLQ